MSQRSISQLFINPLGHRFATTLATLSLSAAVALASATAVAQQPEHAHQTDHTAQYGQDVAATTPAAQRKAATDSTEAFISAHKQWTQARGASNKAAALQTLIAKTEARRELMAELIRSNPAEALRVAIPAEKQTGMPAQVQAMLELRFEVEGELEAVYEDFLDGSHKLRHFLNTPFGERFEIHAAGKVSHLPSNSKVRLNGLLLDGGDSESGGNIALESGEENILTLQLGGNETGGSNGGSPAPVANTLGEQKTLVIMVNFQDKPEQPYTADYAREVIFGETSDYFMENSFGQTWLNGDVTGWYTLPMSSTVCEDNNLRAYANEAVAAAGIDLASYDRLVYTFPQNACGYWGTASVGRSPSYTLINGDLELAVTGHEMGHNFGLYHSHSLTCNDGSSVGSAGPDVLAATPWANCSNLEYGDGLDTMGWSGSAHTNAVQKERMGWLNYDQSPPLTTVTTGGSYTIAPYAAQDGASKALKILKAPADQYGYKTWYYVEYRQAVGFDSILTSSLNQMDSDNVLNGVTVHVGYEGNDGNNTYLLDMTPQTNADLYTRDPALVSGASFTDPDGGVTITTDWTDASGATVNVSFGGSPAPACQTANPSVSVTPGQSPWLTAGSSYTYSVTVTNNDSSACSNSTFNLAAGSFAGWSTSFSNGSVTLAPGDSTSTTVTVSSASSATDGFYNIDVTAASGAYSATDAATFVIDTPVSGNSAPVAVNDNTTISTKSPVTIQILGNDWDPENDTLTLQSVNQGAKGAVQVNADGSVTYTPAKRFKSSDSFSYTITDGDKTAQATVSISLQSSGTDGGTGGGKGGKGHNK